MKFEEWFEQQYGKRPFRASITQAFLRGEMDKAQHVYEYRKREFERLIEYDMRFDSAYKAWMAKRA